MPTILHIGCDKTGTSAIQAALTSSRALLSASGFNYPDVDGRPDHRSLLSEPHRLEVDEDGATLVLSYEGFWPEGPEALAPLLERLPAPIRVVAWARSPQRYVDAAFRQQCKHAKSPAHLRVLLGAAAMPPAINPLVRRCVRRFEQIRPWNNAFGDSLEVFDYEAESADVVAAFVEHTGLPGLEVGDQRKNARPSVNALHAFALARKEGRSVHAGPFFEQAAALGEVAQGSLVPEPAQRRCWEETAEARRSVGLNQPWVAEDYADPRLDAARATILLEQIADSAGM